ncbi:MAG TPA: response regulator, partial [Desulfobacterales bacterium]|nr:response regulator [Desulfobacterales bacterium]
DDEREFAQTLSERLLMRDMGSAVAYDGESALAMINEDEPEVMILDLKMPGIDGIEVLKRVKQTRPAIEVIILTGHGSEEDRKTCLELGAFAYLQKPVDIELLTETLKKANEQMRQNLAGGKPA